MNDTHDQHEARIAELDARKAHLKRQRDEQRERLRDARFRLKSLDPLKRDAMAAAGIEVEPELRDWRPEKDETAVRAAARQIEVLDQALQLIHARTMQLNEERRLARVTELDAALTKLADEIAELELPIGPLRTRWRQLHDERQQLAGGTNFAQYVRMGPNDRR